MNTIRVGSLVLEPQVAAHADEMYKVLSDPAIYEFENSPPESLEWLTERFTKREFRVSRDGTEQWLNWVIRTPSGALAGYVQASIVQDGTVHIAYVLASKFWRQRIGSTAVSAMLEEVETTYGACNFTAALKTQNFRSLGLLKSLGFEQVQSNNLDETVMFRKGSDVPKALAQSNAEIRGV